MEWNCCGIKPLALFLAFFISFGSGLIIFGILFGVLGPSTPTDPAEIANYNNLATKWQSTNRAQFESYQFNISALLTTTSPAPPIPSSSQQPLPSTFPSPSNSTSPQPNVSDLLPPQHNQQKHNEFNRGFTSDEHAPGATLPSRAIGNSASTTTSQLPPKPTIKTSEEESILVLSKVEMDGNTQPDILHPDDPIFLKKYDSFRFTATSASQTLDGSLQLFNNPVRTNFEKSLNVSISWLHEPLLSKIHEEEKPGSGHGGITLMSTAALPKPRRTNQSPAITGQLHVPPIYLFLKTESPIYKAQTDCLYGFMENGKCYLVHRLREVCIKVKIQDNGNINLDNTYGGVGCGPTDSPYISAVHSPYSGLTYVYSLLQSHEYVYNHTVSFHDLVISLRSSSDPYIYAMHITNGSMNFSPWDHFYHGSNSEEIGFVRGFFGFGSLGLGALIVLPSLFFFVLFCFCSTSLRQRFMIEDLREEHALLLNLEGTTCFETPQGQQNKAKKLSATKPLSMKGSTQKETRNAKLTSSNSSQEQQQLDSSSSPMSEANRGWADLILEASTYINDGSSTTVKTQDEKSSATGKAISVHSVDDESTDSASTDSTLVIVEQPEMVVPSRPSTSLHPSNINEEVPQTTLEGSSSPPPITATILPTRSSSPSSPQLRSSIVLSSSKARFKPLVYDARSRTSNVHPEKPATLIGPVRTMGSASASSTAEKLQHATGTLTETPHVPSHINQQTITNHPKEEVVAEPKPSTKQPSPTSPTSANKPILNTLLTPPQPKTLPSDKYVQHVHLHHHHMNAQPHMEPARQPTNPSVAPYPYAPQPYSVPPPYHTSGPYMPPPYTYHDPNYVHMMPPYHYPTDAPPIKTPYLPPDQHSHNSSDSGGHIYISAVPTRYPQPPPYAYPYPMHPMYLVPQNPPVYGVRGEASNPLPPVSTLFNTDPKLSQVEANMSKNAADTAEDEQGGKKPSLPSVLGKRKQDSKEETSIVHNVVTVIQPVTKRRTKADPSLKYNLERNNIILPKQVESNILKIESKKFEKLIDPCPLKTDILELVQGVQENNEYRLGDNLPPQVIQIHCEAIPRQYSQAILRVDLLGRGSKLDSHLRKYICELTDMHLPLPLPQKGIVVVKNLPMDKPSHKHGKMLFLRFSLVCGDDVLSSIDSKGFTSITTRGIQKRNVRK